MSKFILSEYFFSSHNTELDAQILGKNTFPRRIWGLSQSTSAKATVFISLSLLQVTTYCKKDVSLMPFIYLSPWKGTTILKISTEIPRSHAPPSAIIAQMSLRCCLLPTTIFKNIILWGSSPAATHFETELGFSRGVSIRSCTGRGCGSGLSPFLSAFFPLSSHSVWNIFPFYFVLFFPFFPPFLLLHHHYLLLLIIISIGQNSRVKNKFDITIGSIFFSFFFFFPFPVWFPALIFVRPEPPSSGSKAAKELPRVPGWYRVSLLVWVLSLCSVYANRV